MLFWMWVLSKTPALKVLKCSGSSNKIIQM